MKQDGIQIVKADYDGVGITLLDTVQSSTIFSVFSASGEAETSLVSDGSTYTLMNGALGGGAGGVSFTPFITMHWEMVPGEKRGRWYSMEGLIGISAIPAAIIGGILWQRGLMIEVLLLPILLEVLVVIPIMTMIPDTLNRNDR